MASGGPREQQVLEPGFKTSVLYQASRKTSALDVSEADSTQRHKGPPVTSYRDRTLSHRHSRSCLSPCHIRSHRLDGFNNKVIFSESGTDGYGIIRVGFSQGHSGFRVSSCGLPVCKDNPVSPSPLLAGHNTGWGQPNDLMTRPHPPTLGTTELHPQTLSSSELGHFHKNPVFSKTARSVVWAQGAWEAERHNQSAKTPWKAWGGERHEQSKQWC